MSLELQATGIKSCSYFTFVINQLIFGRQHNFKPHHFSTVPQIRACRDTFFVILYTVYTGIYYTVVSIFFFRKFYIICHHTTSHMTLSDDVTICSTKTVSLTISATFHHN